MCAIFQGGAAQCHLVRFQLRPRGAVPILVRRWLGRRLLPYVIADRAELHVRHANRASLQTPSRRTSLPSGCFTLHMYNGTEEMERASGRDAYGNGSHATPRQCE
ncbi:unnamed protein product [Lota lota]